MKRDFEVVETATTTTLDTGGPLLNDNAELVGVSESELLGQQYAYYISVREVKNIPGITEDQLRHVLGQNARHWFNLKDEDLPVR